ncbi:hypothetical protein [Halobacillus sp. Marseille-Q1614]|uniref:hypothetical protein n=1 Tax=Halobacillus sp. Marseille-Q1614 TaxID=2709134 RepID=UPI00156D58CF|nr:hypothetical protein [Halobacillus sp. Marseille-Q1614]
MGERNKIIISYKDKEKNQQIIQAKEEQAAAQIKSIEEYHKTKTHVKKARPLTSTLRKSLAPSSIKHVTLSIVTALVVSLVLGFILLKIFVAATDGGTLSQPLTPEGTATAAGQAGQVTLEIPGLQTIVIQSGVFSSAEKAEEWQSNLQDQSISSIIWKKDDQYFLLSGSEDLSSDMKGLAEDYSAKNIPTYTKEWEVSGGQVSVMDGQSAVVETIIEHLQAQSLHTVPAEEREQLLLSYQQSDGPAPQFLEALKEWNTGEENGVSWLAFAQALNSMKNE